MMLILTPAIRGTSRVSSAPPQEGIAGHQQCGQNKEHFHVGRLVVSFLFLLATKTTKLKGKIYVKSFLRH